MIFRILLICFSYFSICASGQDALLVIASHSEGVLVDNAPVSVGQLISSNAKKLLIPKDGFAVVLSGEGSYKFTKSVSIAGAAGKISGLTKPKIKFFEAGIIGTIPEIFLMGTPQNQNSNILGDSILIAIKFNYNKPKPPYMVHFTTMFGDYLLSSDSVYRNWSVHGIKSNSLLTSEKLLFFRVAGNGYSREFLIKRIEDTRVKPLNDALSAVANSGSSEILKLAILESNNLQYDHLFLLYQLTRSNYKPENEILAAYFNGLKEKYNFDLFNFKE